MFATKPLYTDAIAHDTFYAGVLRDEDWVVIANCQHRHRTRVSAERCAAIQWTAKRHGGPRWAGPSK